MPPRSIGTATISFGLVSIPIKIYTALQTSEGIHFRMLHSKCNTPIRQQLWCPTDEEKVERDDIVKGYEYARDQFVIFTDEEIETMQEDPSHAVDIVEFVPLERIDPVYFDRPYYLSPDRGGERAYALLSSAMGKAELGGIARYAARGKQYLVLLRPLENGLVMQELRYAYEVRPISEVPISEKGEVREAELKLALQLIEGITSDAFHPENYRDEVRERMQGMIEQKVEGAEIIVPRAEAPKAQVIDLMEALEASIRDRGRSAGREETAQVAEGGARGGAGRSKAAARGGARPSDQTASPPRKTESRKEDRKAPKASPRVPEKQTARKKRKT